MQIKVEIELKPEELRRFLGLPDVAGLQEDLIGFLKDKVGQASDGLSPAADFVRGNIEHLWSSNAVQKLLSSVKVRSASETDAEPGKAAKKTRLKPRAAASPDLKTRLKPRKKPAA